VDGQLAKHPSAATLEMWTRNRENMLLGNCSIFGFIGNVGYGIWALAEENVTPNTTTDAVVSCLNGLQRDDGRWEGDDIRPPLAGRFPIIYTAFGIRALRVYSPPAVRDEIRERVARARDYMRRATPGDTQDESFKLLGLVWSETPAREVSTQTKRLLALQREDGGWGQLPTMMSDAYATGQAMYALHASGVPPSNAAYRKAAQYLLRTQLDDGTWYVRSRAIALQPYFETGFPHGTDQFISSAATSWAVIGLAASPAHLR
jgi:hypothetical protein